MKNENFNSACILMYNYFHIRAYILISGRWGAPPRLGTIGRGLLGLSLDPALPRRIFPLICFVLHRNFEVYATV